MGLTIAVLSWGADKTLDNTLKSYRYRNLKADQKIVLLQEGTRQQELIVRYWGFIPITLPFNVGIAKGYDLLLQYADEEYFLFLENDWELITNPEGQLQLGKVMIDTTNTDVVRLRSRENPGNPLWTRQFEGNEYLRPSHLLDSIHWTDPAKFPEISTNSFEVMLFNGFDLTSKEPWERKTIKWYKTSSKYANWTNNPHMAKTSFLRKNIAPRLTDDDIEKSIQPWWEQQNFYVAQSDGLFTHNRMD